MLVEHGDDPHPHRVHPHATRRLEVAVRVAPPVDETAGAQALERVAARERVVVPFCEVFVSKTNH